MINVVEKKLCCGCTACYSICPTQCISMKEDSEGFFYPHINKDKCTNCNLCEKVCPFENNTYERKPQATIGAINKDCEIQINSTSGGVFYELAKHILLENGVVYGAALVNMKALHINVTDMTNLGSLQGSKYVQSELKMVYNQVIDALEEGKTVLFSGTPCQVHGLNNLLSVKKINVEKLLLVETVCRSIPSPKVFHNYIAKLENDYGSKVIKFKFRDKQKAWDDSNVLVEFVNGKRISEKTYENDYMKLFYNDLISRPSCEACKSKGNRSNADITLGDFWTVKNRCPEIYDKKGVSLVLINSAKGMSYLQEIESSLNFQRLESNEILIDSIYLTQSYSANKNREELLKKINSSNFSKLVKAYTDSIGRFKRVRGVLNVFKK